MKPTLLLLFLLSLSKLSLAGPSVTTKQIKVDQFGYRITALKIAVIADPQAGYDSALSFTPGGTYQVRRWSDDAVVFSGAPVAWNGGATHAQSGDKVWRFDFSALTMPGDYYVFDVGNSAGSYRFTIGDEVYNNVLRTALRTFYYQRCGTAKAAPYAAAGWTDAVCHSGAGQDAACVPYNASSPAYDLRGGWHDAGDYNKYVNFAYSPVINLLLAYEEAPGVWPDNFNIPESGNGIPDVLDEVKYELDWLLRMQRVDGSVLSVVGVASGSASPPSSDALQRRYGPATTSATWSAAAMFALGAIQFASLNTAAATTYSNTLRDAAINAWNWAVAHPAVTFYNSGTIAAGEQEVSTDERQFRRLAAASFLYLLTGSATYKSYFESNYGSAHLIQWSYAYPFEHATQDALLYYTRAGGANSSIATAIRNAFGNSVTSSNDNWNSYLTDADAYRAFLKDNNYTWGSNTTKGNQANMYLSMNAYNLTPANAAGYRNAAAGYVHYLHGVNPVSTAYLSNMAGDGAENSVNEFYHAWFADGSALWDRVGTSTYGPAPGFMTGGPNPSYQLDGCCTASSNNCSWTALCNGATVAPPVGQPIQKSYKDWNTSWPQNSWEITENAIYTQAAYLRLLSKFASPPPLALPIDQTDFTVQLVSRRLVQLRWQRGREAEGGRYEIERSSDGRQFSAIAFKKADGRIYYQVMDPDPVAGSNFYRIKTVSASGSLRYTPVREVLVPGEEQWRLFPNPAGETVSLLPPPGMPGGAVVITVTDVAGSSVLRVQAALRPGEAYPLDLRQLSAGSYLLSIQEPDKRVILRLSKQ